MIATSVFPGREGDCVLLRGCGGVCQYEDVGLGFGRPGSWVRRALRAGDCISGSVAGFVVVLFTVWVVLGMRLLFGGYVTFVQEGSVGLSLLIG